MNIITDAENWLSKAWKSVTAWITKAEVTLQPAIVIAENVLNAIKAFDGSVVGQTVESIIEAEIPAATGLINAFKLQLPVWLIELNWISAESSKSLEDQWGDALAYLATIKDADVYASQLNTLKALFTKFFGNNEQLPVTIQQALTLAQPTHAYIS